MLLLPLVLGVLATANDLSSLPDDINLIIQEHALHLYKFQQSPIASILDSTATRDYFPLVVFDLVTLNDTKAFGYVSYPEIEYTLPMGRYLTLYERKARDSRDQSVGLKLEIMEENHCQDVGLYYFDGGDAQVLPARDTLPGFSLVRSSRQITLTYQLTARQTDRRQILLFIPFDCKLGVNYLILFEKLLPGETEQALAGSSRSVVI